MHESNQRLDARRIPLEHRLHGALGRVPHPAGDSARLGEATRGVTKENALDPAVDDDSSADHGTWTRYSSSS
jgi:hypothetical protein